MLVLGFVTSSCSLSMASAPLCSRAELPSPAAQVSSMLDSAADLMIMHKDFKAAFDTCDRGLRSLSNTEHEDSRTGDLKAGFCILGIQALAELNQWQRVFSWILLQYQDQVKIPAKILQMCILLYSKVGEPVVMQEAARVWLRCPSNSGASGFGTVAELYLLHVLVPLGHKDEALELIKGDVGSVAFTEDQRQAALEVLKEKETPREEPPESPRSSPEPDASAAAASTQGSMLRKLEAMFRCLYRKVFASCSGSFSLRRLFLAAVLLYMLLLRLDPALPSSFMWISKLHQLLRQMWTVMFAPYYKAVTQSKRL
ncbi:peroxisome assembly protein 26 [Notolabrus celidotus]|uniref:peroxisome assembly protein 26 n=1 Tax=Notolabrus celidotus TaxID=1203425 RepID=UPI00148FD32F|nr:peroxisome assembly protein 26 [Notolabrus celidotus]